MSYHSTGLDNIKVHKRPEKLSLYEREKKHMEYKERLLSAKREKQVKEYVNSLSAKEVRKELIERMMDEYDESVNRNYW